MEQQSSHPSHNPTILILVAIILLGLLGLPPCNNPGCGDISCLFFPDNAKAIAPMGLQSVDPRFIRSRQRDDQPKEMILVIPPAKPAYIPALDTLKGSSQD